MGTEINLVSEVLAHRSSSRRRALPDVRAR
jgi:hypothetical protein